MDITTATLPASTAAPTVVLIHYPGDTVVYAALNADAATAIDMLRRALIHLVADAAGFTTVPLPAAIVTNGHGANGNTPPLRVPRDLPKSSTDAAGRKRPGPKPGTPRPPRRRADADDIDTQAERDTW